VSTGGAEVSGGAGVAGVRYEHDRVSDEPVPGGFAGHRETGVVTACDPPHRLAFTWQDPGPVVSHVEFRRSTAAPVWSSRAAASTCPATSSRRPPAGTPTSTSWRPASPAAARRRSGRRTSAWRGSTPGGNGLSGIRARLLRW
jgi:hypothetical protein